MIKYILFVAVFLAVIATGIVFIYNKNSSPIGTLENDAIFVTEFVFVGRVVREIGRKSVVYNVGSRIDENFPATQYEVEVLRNLKGELNGVIVVNLPGGTTERGTTHVVNNNSAIKPGEVYAFPVNYDASEKWYAIDSQLLRAEP